LLEAGVKIYEYEPGFMHAKSLISDDIVGFIGTINFDYRSFVHHFECGVIMYKTKCLKDIKKDIKSTLDKSLRIDIGQVKNIVGEDYICLLLICFRQCCD
jgi:cardiolipin synthase